MLEPITKAPLIFGLLSFTEAFPFKIIFELFKVAFAPSPVTLIPTKTELSTVFLSVKFIFTFLLETNSPLSFSVESALTPTI